MKKVFLSLIISSLFISLSFSAPFTKTAIEDNDNNMVTTTTSGSDVGLDVNIVGESGITVGSRVAYRTTITADDTFTYGSGDTGLKIDCSGYGWIRLYFDITGSTSMDFTPYFGDSTASTYYAGDSYTISSDVAYDVFVAAEDEFAAFMDSESGSVDIDIAYVLFNK